MPEEARDFMNGHWRFFDYISFLDDTLNRYGAVASVCLSMAYKPKRIVEMGVYSGCTSFLLARANPDAQVYGVDINRLAGGLKTGLTVLTHKCSNYQLFFEDSSNFEVQNVDMCFIDGDHCGDAPYHDSLRAWKNRNVNRDWCIAWDDYHESNPDVVNSVNRFVDEVGMELRTLMSWVYIGTLPHSAVEAFL
jgi:hypothetical protein